MSLVQLIRRFPPTRQLVYRLGIPRAHDMLAQFERFLAKDSGILDIGPGTGNIDSLLMAAGHSVIPLDVKDLSFTDQIRPQLYDGEHIPYGDTSFDTALLLTVLHHTPDPDQILSEASRVARQVIVIEDVYSSRLHKYATFFVDSLLNLEFIGHPHTNRTDEAWKATFTRLGLRLEHEQAHHSHIVMQHKLYVLFSGSTNISTGKRIAND